jgi:hypothetical protein
MELPLHLLMELRACFGASWLMFIQDGGFGPSARSFGVFALSLSHIRKTLPKFLLQGWRLAFLWL